MANEQELINGFATSEGTQQYVKYAVKEKSRPESHFRVFDNLHLSSLGMGTYLGEITDYEDEAMEHAIYESIKSGAMNVIDTAINYRAMKSEKSIGRALSRLIRDRIISRDQVFVSTKNGYITNDGDFPSIEMMEYMQKMYITPGLISPSDISSGYNVLNPTYIERCIDKSLSNMKLNTIDLVYVHNSFESWYQDVTREEYMEKLRKVFQVYEKYRARNKLRYYGMATWTCFRVPNDSNEYLSLEEVVKLAEDVNEGGLDKSGFRFIQLPYNLAYSEPLLLKNQTVGNQENLTILEAASKLKIGVFTSIPLFQGRLLRANIPSYKEDLTDPVAKIVQVIRSTPSVIAPLIGQKRPEHVEQNLRLASVPPLQLEEYKRAINILLGKT
ncbi:MAG TPA: aldo/keto reductase [Nitrososphaeraceae archaeon]|nr:aldo/keto reductase [Nitrososphaeraceae archaeon]